MINSKYIAIAIALTNLCLIDSALSQQESNNCASGLYPSIADTTHASSQAVELFHDYFTAKSNHNPDAFLQTFHPNETEYLDSTLGRTIAANRSALVTGQQRLMARWNQTAPNGRCYPLRILGDTVGGALVYFVDTPELFGAEIRAISSFDFLDGKIRRQLDNWDGRNNSVKATLPPDAQYPYDLGLQGVPELAATPMKTVVDKLQSAMSSGDYMGTVALFSSDALFEDITLRARVEGRIAITSYLQRALQQLPYGPGAKVKHILGSAVGGGYEWRPDRDPEQYGVVALELDCSSQITRFSSIWDGSRLSYTQIEDLARLSVSP